MLGLCENKSRFSFCNIKSMKFQPTDDHVTNGIFSRKQQSDLLCSLGHFIAIPAGAVRVILLGLGIQLATVSEVVDGLKC